ncbi:MAG: DUF3617 domain-containing protein [Burkholderiales bacterium]
MRVAATCVLAAAVLVPHAYGAAPNMREGEWEITLKMEMPGMPMAMPPQVMSRCVTKKDLANPVPGPQAGDSRCKTTDHRMQGNTATWKMACEDGTTGSGTATYSDTSYTSTITTLQGGQAPAMTMRQNGRYLGACRKP